MTTIEFLRQFKLGGYSIFDFVLTFLFMALLAPFLSKAFFKKGIYVPKRSWLLWAVPLSIPVHLLFGAMTPMTVAFIDMHGHYLLKLVILGLFIAGFFGVRRCEK